jgi:beta-lactamase regulating signal transducer with metallopeptidase domain
MTAVFFNLLVNSAFSLACGILVISAFLWLFRIETGSYKLFFLSLPFVKVIYDCVRGLPANSILFTNLDPFSLPPRHQSLSLSAKFNLWGPVFNVELTVQDLKGKEYGASIGDYLVLWLKRNATTTLPFLILAFVASVSFFLLARRAYEALRFERTRRRDKRESAHLSARKSRARTVDVYISKTFSGSPFTGGLLRPYICLTGDAYQKLSAAEIEAVIAHELGHVQNFDLVGTIFVQIFGDLFWFVPGYRPLARKIDRLREIVADQWAVRAGIEPTQLAMALIKLKEIPLSTNRFLLYSAFFREKALLKERVDRLLGVANDQRSRLGWQYKWTRLFVSFWIFSAVMFATLGGNAGDARLSHPGWLHRWMDLWFKSFGLN